MWPPRLPSGISAAKAVAAGATSPTQCSATNAVRAKHTEAPRPHPADHDDMQLQRHETRFFPVHGGDCLFEGTWCGLRSVPLLELVYGQFIVVVVVVVCLSSLLFVVVVVVVSCIWHSAFRICAFRIPHLCISHSHIIVA